MPSTTANTYFDSGDWVPLDEQGHWEPDESEKVKQLLADVAIPALANKETIVSEAKPSSNDDMPPAIRLYRDGEAVVTALCEAVNRDHALEFAWLSVPTFQADAVTMAFDIHQSHSALNPITGSPWGPHEMHGLCDKLGYCDTGLLTDALFVMRFERSGASAAAFFPYHAHHSKHERTAARPCRTQRPNRKKKAHRRTLVPGTVVWSDTAEYQITAPGGESKLGGLIPDSIAQAFHATEEFPWEEIQQKAAELGVSEHCARILADVTVSEMIAQEGRGRWAIMLMGQAAEAARS